MHSPHSVASRTHSIWVVILAGGEGRRLEEASRAHYGTARPKQFCDYGCGCTLLGRTISRARAIAPDDRIVVVTTRAHAEFADEVLANYPGVRRVEQPRNLDTTPGLLLPLLEVIEEDPTARVVVMPSDHFVTNEARFMDQICAAAHSLLEDPDAVLLLGAPATTVDEGFGWIVPAPVPGERWPRVARFREKPDADESRALVKTGALRNTFVLVAEAVALVSLVHAHAPFWYRALRHAARDPGAVEDAYAKLPPSNFSHDVLARAQADLRVVPMGDVGWDDIGTPDRLGRAMATERGPAAK